MSEPTVFISYSHDSPEHEERVLDLSAQLRGDGIDCTIDRYETSPPEGWPNWMIRQVENSDFVVVVCTETYYRRAMGQEEQGKGRGVKLESTLAFQKIFDNDAMNTRFIPVFFDSEDVEYIPTLLRGATYYCVNTDQGYEVLYRHLTGRPYVKKPELGKLKELPQREQKREPVPIKVILRNLPQTSHDLVGREEELKMLDDAWDDSQTNVLCLVAWGGIGKTSLVNEWLRKMGAEDFRGAERVFGWSFYSQGTSKDRQASADQFIATALRQFGDPDPTAGSPWDKGERLAQLIRKQKTLLILDGVEPLQYQPGEMKGRVKDAALEALLKELVYQNPGLCIVTTRWELGDLMARQTELVHLSPEAGAQLLLQFGVKGTPDELKEASVEFGGHALALTLLGSLLVDSEEYDGDIRCRREIPPLEWDIDEGGHARRVMESYERYLGESPELSILHLMGLFDRPAEAGALAILREAPVISGLTDRLFTSEGKPLSDREWDRAVAKLRRARLLLERDPDNPGALDAHPLVREHFGEKLRDSNADAWREAHSRLYEYYKSVPEKNLPDTLDEMMPLYAAVAHGCQADLHKKAFDEVYVPRIIRVNDYYSVKKLGAFGADLAAISGFFDPPWRKPVDGLTEGNKSILLSIAGFYLRALGRLAEAAQPMQVSLEALIAQKDWVNAAGAANNLCELHLTMGEVKKALDYARQSVDYADRSGDAFLRMGLRTTLADALHHSGKLEEAEAAFIQAEEMQRERQPSSPLLYSLWGFRYCDLLLEQGEYREVLNRAEKALDIVLRGSQNLIDIALNHLSLGRAHLLQAQEETGDFLQACAQLDQAVDGLRQFGHQEFISRGLLARAELHRVMGNFGRAKHDLDEAMSIATRGGMRLHEADCHLGFARLHLDMGEKAKARGSLAKAKMMIDEMGYHRRDGEVRELEEKAGKREDEKVRK